MTFISGTEILLILPCSVGILALGEFYSARKRGRRLRERKASENGWIPFWPVFLARLIRGVKNGTVSFQGVTG